jgi:L-fucose isomerase-like protein
VREGRRLHKIYVPLKGQSYEVFGTPPPSSLTIVNGIFLLERFQSNIGSGTPNLPGFLGLSAMSDL